MKTFKDIQLADELQSALNDLNFIKPTEIQTAVIPLAMQGRDLMACAETGSGKTAGYGIPLVSKLLEDAQRGALVLAPTRELAQQIADFLRALTAHCSQLQVVSLVGGADIRKQLNALKRNPRIIVATPGRLTDHLRRKSVQLDSTDLIVLDEGDRMLDMGFAPQLDVILKYVPKVRHTLLFTATLPERVQKLARKYLNKPEKISVGRVSLPVKSIKQSVVQVGFKEKDDRIVDELNQREGSVIVFARTKNRTNILARNLLSYGFKVDLIHGGRTQGQRNKALQNFKNGRSRILCATDVAARGIDVPQVEHVINFDLPMMDEDYVHRIGRTARNGAKGEAVSFVTPQEHSAWHALVRKYKIEGVDLKGVSAGRSQKKRRSSSRDRDASESSFRDRRGKPASKKKSRFAGDSEPTRSKFSKGPKSKSKPSRSEGTTESSFKKKKTSPFSKFSGGFKKQRSKGEAAQKSR